MPVETEMPRYQCHKTVWALKIKEVQDTSKPNEETDGSRLLVFEDEGYAPIRVSFDYVRKHSPEPGGYYVVYKDGYKSFSPARAFEEGYTRVELEDVAEQATRGVTVSEEDPLVIEQPRDLDDCFRILEGLMTPEQRRDFKTRSTAEYHHGVGRLLRNEWGLWYDPGGVLPETEIHRYMAELGLEHADDMSGLILDSFQRHLRGEPLDIEGQVAKYKAYWAELKED